MTRDNLAQYGVTEGDVRQVFGRLLVDIAHRDPDVLVVDCQTAMPTGAIAMARALPERFIDLGIAEQNAVSFAAGLARMGFTPILPLFACFSARRALDQISVQIAYARQNVKVCGLYAGLTSPNTGATHQMIQDVAIMRSMPNMDIVEPADAAELAQALPIAVARRGPVYFRLVRGDIGGPCPQVVPPDYHFEFGKACLLRSGRDVTLVGSGLMVSRCLRAADILAQEGIEADVINVSTIKPLDTALLFARAQRTGAIVTAENHSIIGGLGGAVGEALSECCPVPIKRVGVADQYGTSGPLEELFALYGLTPECVCEAARAAIRLKGNRLHDHEDNGTATATR